MNWLAIAFSLWNIIVIFLYAIDKRRAKRRGWRISESTLVLSAFFLGSIGAMLGMVLFNHKTSKMKFRLLIPLAFLANVGIVLLFDYLVK